jgi:hypothetical protein
MSGLSGELGFSNSKSKYNETTSIDSLLRGMQEQNYAGARGLAANYKPTSADDISRYMNPYIADVVDSTMAGAQKGQRMALNLVGDRASAAGAFGGSRHGVAEGVALGEFDQNLGGLLGNLYAQGYEGARDTAQQEHQFEYAYPLQRQGIENATLAGITPTTTTSGSKKTSTIGGSLGFTYGGK